MVDQESIQRHYKTREELKQIEHEDNARKSLIKLSILQVVTNNHFKSLQPVGRARRAKKPPVIPRKLVSPTNLSGEQLNEYEVAINNLKLEHSTTSKLQEARINALKEENMKLKTQVKDLKLSTSKPSLLNFGSGPFSIKSRTSTMVSPSLKVPTSFNKISGPSVPPFNPLSVFDTIMTPVRKSKLTLNRPTRSKAEFSPPPVHSDTTSTTVGFRSSSAVPSSPTRADISSSTPTKYMASFDKSENEGSSSPDFTPKRSKYKDKISADETEFSSFVSANSTLRGDHDTDTEKDTEKPRRSKRIRKPSKKLQLSKSKRTLGAKTGKNGADKLSHGLDDDDLNHLNFYADENFKDLGLSPPKKRQRGDDDDDDAESQQPKPKKQKNVFSIE
ncbi:hypothetical protein Cantr_07449 [Candida viswanathii]|uniref:Uncharacterized protein n=1 Tax=Candida viswanathii TaxID=5486 RepID=A0A367XZ97_9ASCO|nr:hypothetical protein Cantr_07449 [Candida viswanathii]